MKRFISVIGILFAAVCLGVTPAVSAAAGELTVSTLFLLTAVFLSSGIILMIGFSATIKQDGFKGFCKGFLPGILLLAMIYCLAKGGYGIVWSISLPLILLIELLGQDGTPSAKSIAALFLIFGGLLILTDTVRVELFPFSFAVCLPEFEVSLLWQAAGSILSVLFLYIGKKTAPNCSGTTIAASAFLTAGLISLFFWCFTEQAVLPTWELKLFCLLAWYLFICAISGALILCGVRHCRIIPCKTALAIAPAVQLLVRLALARSFPPEFDTMVGIFFLAAAILIAPNHIKQKRQ